MHKKSRGEYKGKRTHDGLKTTFLIPVYLKRGFRQMNHCGGAFSKNCIHGTHVGWERGPYVSPVTSLTMETWVWLVTWSPLRGYSSSNPRFGSERAFRAEG